MQPALPGGAEHASCWPACGRRTALGAAPARRGRRCQRAPGRGRSARRAAADLGEARGRVDAPSRRSGPGWWRRRRRSGCGSAANRCFGLGGAEQVEAEVARRRRRRRPCSSASPSPSKMRTSETTGPPFWARPVWSSPRDCLPSSMRGHAEDLRDRHDAGAADADHAHRASSPGTRASGAGRSAGGSAARSSRRPCRGGHDGQERRAVALEAGVVLVAGRLVDLRLAAELGLHRQHRQAVGLLAAVAAALADALVDQRPAAAASAACRACAGGASRPRTAGRGSARSRPATAASSRCASIERRRGARTSAIGDSATPAVALGLVGGDDDPRTPSASSQRVRSGTSMRPVDVLAAGHRDGRRCRAACR